VNDFFAPTLRHLKARGGGVPDDKDTPTGASGGQTNKILIDATF
jgi:hypothetical protein